MDHLRKLGITQSASRPHVPQDNAVIESFFRSMKAECIYPCRYKSAEDLTHGVEEWLNHYNTSRPHSFNKNKTPDQVESEFLAKLSASDDKSGALTGSI